MAARGMPLHLLLCVFFSGRTIAHMFNFSSPIHYVDSCGSSGSWSIEGKVTLLSSDLDFFAPKLIFRTTNDLCSIDVYSCGKNATSLDSVSDVCVCTNKTGNILNVVVKRQLRANETGQMLQVVLPALDIFNPVNTEFNIGVVPSIYEANVTLTYTVDNAPMTNPLMKSQVLSVCEDALLELEVCASNLPQGSSVTLIYGQQKTSSPGPCVHLAERFNFSHVTLHNVTVTLDDNIGCPVKENFVFNVSGKDCTTTQAPTTTTITTTTSTAAPGTCKPSPSSLAREEVTLPNGVHVLCDTATDGGGWIVFQRRTTGSLSFIRNWDEYRDGFGNLHGEFWLGLEKIRGLCGSRQDNCELRIDLKTSDGSPYFAEYSWFYLTSESDNYRLKVGNYSGTAGDSFSYGNGGKYDIHNMSFTTQDRDNDNLSSNCATDYKSGWWYNACFAANLNAPWGSSSRLQWYPLSTDISFTEMKLRLK